MRSDPVNRPQILGAVALVVCIGLVPGAALSGDPQPKRPSPESGKAPPGTADAASTSNAAADSADPGGSPSDTSGLPDLGLGGLDDPPGTEDAAELSATSARTKPRFSGFVQQETAYAYMTPGRLSTAVIRAQVGASGQIHSNLKWKANFRGEFDPVYAWSDFYPDVVRNDQRLYGLIGETYIDTSVRGWDLRLGRQNIVWGEMVGLFFADVVTAKDLRHFILPSFDIIRIPQWAARGEYFFGNSHVELVWIPYTSFDRIGKPGSEFYPFPTAAPPGFTNQFLDDQIPARSLANSNIGARVSTLIQGWDLSTFFYRSMDSAATFYREIVPTGPSTGILRYTPRHDRISQFGGTVSKDATDSVVFKAEAVFTSGRSFNVTRATQPGGVIQKDTLDYALGIDVSLPDEARMNVQFFQRAYLAHDPDMIQERFESGATFLYNTKVRQSLEAEVLWIQSLNRNESLVRPRLVWHPEPNLRVSAGLDIFTGPETGVIGRFASRDRIYVETRYSF